MARKDIFSSVMSPAPARPERNDALSYVVSGASRSIKSSFEELAKGSVVELDPELIDGSFVSDRIDDDDEAFEELLVAVKERGEAGKPDLVAKSCGKVDPGAVCAGSCCVHYSLGSEFWCVLVVEFWHPDAGFPRRRHAFSSSPPQHCPTHRSKYSRSRHLQPVRSATCSAIAGSADHF